MTPEWLAAYNELVDVCVHEARTMNVSLDPRRLCVHGSAGPDPLPLARVRLWHLTPPPPPPAFVLVGRFSFVQFRPLPHAEGSRQ